MLRRSIVNKNIFILQCGTFIYRENTSSVQLDTTAIRYDLHCVGELMNETIKSLLKKYHPFYVETRMHLQQMNNCFFFTRFYSNVDQLYFYSLPFFLYFLIISYFYFIFYSNVKYSVVIVIMNGNLSLLVL